MQEHKQETHDKASQLQTQWVGVTHNDEGQVSEVRSIKNSQPYMVTYDSKGKCNGFGYV